MEEFRDSELLEAGELDLVDFSGIEEENMQNTMGEGSSMHQASSISSKGFCVKDYETKMDNLKKENFNLKLRLYFLEQKNVTLPEGIEQFQKQFIDLKQENETLSNDLKEKQELLHQASIALELLEEEKLNSQSNSEVEIADLKNKMKLLEQENINLQQTVNDMNKTNVGNDTGYADFLGAVDMRDIEMQRKILEMTQMCEEYKQKINNLNQEMNKVKTSFKNAELKISELQYERDELNDKFKTAEVESKNSLHKIQLLQELLAIRTQDMQYMQFQIENFSKRIQVLNEKCEGLELSNFNLFMNLQDCKSLDAITELEKELKEFKEKWAYTQCELNDMEQKFKDSEEEREKTLNLLTKSLQSIDEEREKVNELENLLKQKQSTGVSEREAKKDVQILALKKELEATVLKLKKLKSSELKEKDQEIERLNTVVNQMKAQQKEFGNNSNSRFSFDALYESFNDLKLQQAMMIKNESQNKIYELMQELVSLANSKTKNSVIQLKEQIEIVIENQQIADNALSKCTELCSCTLDHLYELTQFLTLLLQNKEIRESLSHKSLADIQGILDKSIEFSRFSIDGGRITAFPDLSMLGNLLNTTRDSISNIQQQHADIEKLDACIQAATACDRCDDLEFKLNDCTREFEEIKKVNQLLEDEICEYRSTLEMRDDEIKKCNEDLKFLKESEMEINIILEDCRRTIQTLQMDKLNISSKLEKSGDVIQKLECKLKEMEQDLSQNYMLKVEHEENLNKFKEEVVNAEAQTAAIRLELEEIRNLYPKYKFNSTKTSLTSSDDFKENEEYTNACAVTSNNLELEINHVESSSSCKKCPKYQSQVKDLKAYLQACVNKLQQYADQKARLDQHIQKQLSQTEDFLQEARGNMENILKSKENKM